MIAEHFYFHKQDQTAGETISDFDAALKKLEIHYQFGDTLQKMPHDCFVGGMMESASSSNSCNCPY